MEASAISAPQLGPIRYGAPIHRPMKDTVRAARRILPSLLMGAWLPPRLGVRLASRVRPTCEEPSETCARLSPSMSVNGEPDQVDALLGEAERQPFVGWDFS